MSIEIHLEHVVKIFDKSNVVIPDLSLSVKNGEFFTLLGPSGCGKTTLLRMIAGFNTLEGGQIRFDHTVINDVPAYKRNIGMVFQNYAIFPHKNVWENVAFGLRLRHVPKGEMKKRVEEMLALVRMSEYAYRSPDKLSGGQQQRVALARAIVIQPDVLLMDEPLSNLDAKLRLEMRSVIRDIQKKVGITTVYVTHDQEEALAISDRIAVMKGGVIQQLSDPPSLYSRPANTFVASFIGASNMLKGIVEVENNTLGVKLGDKCFVPMTNLKPEVRQGMAVLVSIRPEEFVSSESGLIVTVTQSTFLGQNIQYEISFEPGLQADENRKCELTASIKHAVKIYKPGDKLILQPMSDKINVFTADGEQSLIQGE